MLLNLANQNKNCPIKLVIISTYLMLEDNHMADLDNLEALHWILKMNPLIKKTHKI
jgi:hypothetical protein